MLLLLLPGAEVAISVIAPMRTEWWLVAPGQQCRPGRRAYRGGVKPIELQPFSRQSLSGGVLQGPPKAEAAPKPTSSSMMIKTLGDTLGWAQHSDRRIGRGWNLGVVGRQTNMLRIWNRHLLDRPDIFMTASLDSAESQCIRSERHVTSCRGGQVELVVWLAQMVPAMPSILGDHSRTRTDRI